MNPRITNVSNNRPIPMVVPIWATTTMALTDIDIMVNANTRPAAVTTGVGHQGQIGAVERRLQIGATGSDPGAAVDVQRHGADSRRQRLRGCSPVEIRNPRVAHLGRRLTKDAVQPSNSATRRTSIGPSEPCSGPSKSRSVSIARKCGSTSAQDQPGNAHLSKSSGSPRQK